MDWSRSRVAHDSALPVNSVVAGCRAMDLKDDTERGLAPYIGGNSPSIEDPMVAIALRRFAFAAGALTGVTTTSEAQAPRALFGLVKDSLGHAVPGAEVRARGNVVVAVSDDSGRFHVAQMPVGARGVFVRRLGFAPARAPITPSAGIIDSVRITMHAIAQPLPQITVKDEHDSLSTK